MNRLAASDIKKSSLYRDHQIAVQNALRAFGIASEMEYPALRQGLFHCPKHGTLEGDQILSSFNSGLICNQCRSRVEQMFYYMDNYVAELRLDIESDGKIHVRKNQRGRDEKRDEYLENNLAIHVLRFDNRTDPIAIAKAVWLMRQFKEGK